METTNNENVTNQEVVETTTEVKTGFRPFLFIKSLIVTAIFCLIARYLWTAFIYPWWAFKVSADIKTAIFWIIVLLLSYGVYLDNKEGK